VPVFQKAFVGLITLCALLGGFLFIADLDEQLRIGRAIGELSLIVPLALWLIGRRRQIES